MIAALLNNSTPVEVVDAFAGLVQVQSLGRENLDQHYIGGVGYTGTKLTTVKREALAVVATFDQSDALSNWIDAMNDVDRLADDHHPALAAALDIESDARLAFVLFIHAHSLQPKATEIEFAPNFPLQQCALIEVEDANLCSQGMAVYG